MITANRIAAVACAAMCVVPICAAAQVTTRTAPAANSAPGQTPPDVFASTNRIPRVVVDYAVQHGLAYFGDAQRGTYSWSSGFGFNSSVGRNQYSNSAVLLEGPPAIRQWALNNGFHADGTWDGRNSTIPDLIAFAQHAANERALSDFVNRWSGVVREGSAADLIIAIGNDPVVNTGLAGWAAENHINVTTNDERAAAARRYMSAELDRLDGVIQNEHQYVDAFLRRQQEIEANERALRQMGGEQFVDGDLAGGWNDDPPILDGDWSSTDTARAQAQIDRMRQIGAELRAQILALQGFDLTGGESFASLQFEAIYRNYDPLGHGLPWISLDLYPPGPSLAGQSPDLHPAGMPRAVGWSLDLFPPALCGH
jgi:hypothetical protein